MEEEEKEEKECRRFLVFFFLFFLVFLLVPLRSSCCAASSASSLCFFLKAMDRSSASLQPPALGRSLTVLPLLLLFMLSCLLLHVWLYVCVRWRKHAG